MRAEKVNAPGVLFIVQHLLGMGHLVRASRIARALSEAGFAVTVASGGMPVSGFPGTGVDLLQLPPLRSEPDFARLLDADGNPADRSCWARRQEMLLQAVEQLRPEILITEAFPFGRRMLRPELLPVLTHARGRVGLIVCSLRDILQRNRKPDRDEETIDLVECWYDRVLVHGDPGFAALEDSFPLARQISARVSYTGLVTGPTPEGAAEPFDVLVSAGGGAVGSAVIESALAARPLCRLATGRWCVISGPNVPPHLVPALRRAAAEGVQVHRFREDLPGLLAACRVSVSQAGYNTVADLLQARCRAVLVPYAADGETEQAERAGRLSARGLAQVVDCERLDAVSLAAALDRALDAAPAPRAAIPDLGGARRSAAQLRTLMCGR